MLIAENHPGSCIERICKDFKVEPNSDDISGVSKDDYKRDEAARKLLTRCVCKALQWKHKMHAQFRNPIFFTTLMFDEMFAFFLTVFLLFNAVASSGNKFWQDRYNVHRKAHYAKKESDRQTREMEQMLTDIQQARIDREARERASRRRG